MLKNTEVLIYCGKKFCGYCFNGVYSAYFWCRRSGDVMSTRSFSRHKPDTVASILSKQWLVFYLQILISFRNREAIHNVTFS